MHKVLVAVDGSRASERAVEYLIDLIGRGARSEVHLLNVQPAIPGEVQRFVTQDMIDTYHPGRGSQSPGGRRAQTESSRSCVRHERWGRPCG
jgi:nucleotide-binding universal stress UspA family protein